MSVAAPLVAASPGTHIAFVNPVDRGRVHFGTDSVATTVPTFPSKLRSVTAKALRVFTPQLQYAGFASSLPRRVEMHACCCSTTARISWTRYRKPSAGRAGHVLSRSSQLGGGGLAFPALASARRHSFRRHVWPRVHGRCPWRPAEADDTHANLAALAERPPCRLPRLGASNQPQPWDTPRR